MPWQPSLSLSCKLVALTVSSFTRACGLPPPFIDLEFRSNVGTIPILECDRVGLRIIDPLTAFEASEGFVSILVGVNPEDQQDVNA